MTRSTSPPQRKKRLPKRFLELRQQRDLERAKTKAPAEIDPIKLAKKAAAQSVKVAKRSEAKGGETAEKAKEKREAVETVVDALNGKAPAVVSQETLAKTPPRLQQWAEHDVIFKPNPGPQTEFLAATEREVLFGGSRGPGKTTALLVDPLRYCTNGNSANLILRRTMPELRDMIFKSQEWYPKAFPKAKWREQDKLWIFPSGARIEFGFAETEADLMRYQGRAYSWIGIDEAGQFPSRVYLTRLTGSLRTTDPALPTYIRLTANPGGPGQLWLREDFVDPAPPNTRFEVPLQVKGLDGKVIETSITRRFIPATIYDNPHLLHDASYLAMLANLPETLRKQWLEGDWYADEGRAFPEFDPRVHVVEPFEIPSDWPRFRACDWGYSSPACVLWFAVDWDGNLWVYDELYVKGVTADVFARVVRDRDNGAPMTAQILDASVWQKRGDVGPSIAETMNQNGCRWRPSDRSPRSRISGKLEVHRRLAKRPQSDGTEAPALRVFKTCRNLIKQMQTLPLADNNPEDVDTKAEDHAYDALRYGVMSRPMNPGVLLYTPVDEFRPADPVFGY